MLDLLMNSIPQILAQTTANDFCTQTKSIWKLIGVIVFWIQIAIPVIIILLGTIDLGKAVIGGDDKKVKEAQKAFIMRLIYGVAVFFVIFIVQVIFNAVAEASSTTSSTCWKCVGSRGKC